MQKMSPAAQATWQSVVNHVEVVVDGRAKYLRPEAVGRTSIAH
jgi:hypothetical protein